jgi:hypothetical protein
MQNAVTAESLIPRASVPSVAPLPTATKLAKRTTGKRAGTSLYATACRCGAATRKTNVPDVERKGLTYLVTDVVRHATVMKCAGSFTGS